MAPGEPEALPRAKTNLKLSPDALFDQQFGTGVDPEALVQRLPFENRCDLVRVARKRSSSVPWRDLESRAEEALPEIERFPVHYAEDGIGVSPAPERLRQMVAMQHWQGNTTYTLQDAIRSVVPHS